MEQFKKVVDWLWVIPLLFCEFETIGYPQGYNDQATLNSPAYLFILVFAFTAVLVARSRSVRARPLVFLGVVSTSLVALYLYRVQTFRPVAFFREDSLSDYAQSTLITCLIWLGYALAMLGISLVVGIWKARRERLGKDIQ